MTENINLSYNSRRRHLSIPEYGRYVQQMVDYCKTIEDRESRNNAAIEIMRIMKTAFPQQKDLEEINEKVWVHIHIMAQFQLDIDGDYPTPTPEQVNMKPEPMPYPQQKIKYGHYGSILPRFIDLVKEEQDQEKKEELTLAVVNLMKKTYMNWSDKTIKDDVILNQLNELSDGELSLQDESKIHSNRDINNNTKKKKKNYNKNHNRKNNNNKWGRSR